MHMQRGENGYVCNKIRGDNSSVLRVTVVKGVTLKKSKKGRGSMVQKMEKALLTVWYARMVNPCS